VIIFDAIAGSRDFHAEKVGNLHHKPHVLRVPAMSPLSFLGWMLFRDEQGSPAILLKAFHQFENGLKFLSRTRMLACVGEVYRANKQTHDFCIGNLMQTFPEREKLRLDGDHVLRELAEAFENNLPFRSIPFVPETASHHSDAVAEEFIGLLARNELQSESVVDALENVCELVLIDWS